MRFAVIGVGGVGGYLGGRLARAGNEVVFIARGATLDALRSNGLVLDGPKGGFTVRPAIATDDPAKAGKVDCVMIATKAGQVEDAAQSSLPMLTPHTMVLAVQNGVEAHEIAGRAVGAHRVLIGVCQFSSFVVGPGRVRHVTSLDPEFEMGEAEGRPSERLGTLREVFVRAGINAVAPKDILVALWLKFAAITARAGPGSLTCAPIGGWRVIPETRAISLSAAEEAVAVARTRGVALPADAVQRIMAGTDAFGPEVRMSMQRDIAAGKPSELEFLTGAVVRLGKEAGVPTPTHAFIRAALLPQELHARGEIPWAE